MTDHSSASAPSWYERAACRGLDVALFFPEVCHPGVRRVAAAQGLERVASVIFRFNCGEGDHDWVPVPMDEHVAGWLEWECVVCGERAPDEMQTDLDADYPEELWE